MKKSVNSFYVVAFMGVDGSGKTTLISEIIKFIKNSKYIHLRPYFFLTDRRTSNPKPYKKKYKSSRFFSLIRIFYWLLIYKFFFFIIFKKYKLVIFDRYVHDLLLDKDRYNINLSNKILKKFLNLFPQPDLWIVLSASIRNLAKRKSELTLRQIFNQDSKYKKFFIKKKNIIMINTNNNVKKTILSIKNKLNKKYKNVNKNISSM